MATIREIYDRVLWDSRLDHRAFSLGFSDRISGNMREKRLSEWAVDGDIPWHRIRYVKCGETNAFLVLTVSSAEIGNLEKCGGWIEGHIIGLAINLEQKLNISVRPLPGIGRRQNLVSVALGIVCNLDKDAGTIAQISNEFRDRFNAANDCSSILHIELCDRDSYMVKWLN